MSEEDQSIREECISTCRPCSFAESIGMKCAGCLGDGHRMLDLGGIGPDEHQQLFNVRMMRREAYRRFCQDLEDLSRLEVVIMQSLRTLERITQGGAA